MSVPKTKEEFKQYCLRKLGAPVIEINVSDEQVDDRVDEAFRFWVDYNFDGTEATFYKYQIKETDYPQTLSEVYVIDGGKGYQSEDKIIVKANDGLGKGAEAHLVINQADGSIKEIVIDKPGSGYAIVPTIEIETKTGIGAKLRAFNGGYIKVPDNIVGAINLYPLGDPSIRAGDLFNIRYQIALNDLYTLTSVSMVPYYMAMQHISLIQEILVGKQLIRYNRHSNRLYIDMNWTKVEPGEFFLVEAYSVLDPEVYTDVWNDRWLQNYATEKIKYQWASNMSKYEGMSLPGGVRFNASQMRDEAERKIEMLERDVIVDYSPILIDMIN